MHRMCESCLAELVDFTRTRPTVGVWARAAEHGYERDVICPKCPMCQQAFASAWDPSLKSLNLRNCLP
eukprot:4893156-Prymnesium_polylepis.1